MRNFDLEYFIIFSQNGNYPSIAPQSDDERSVMYSNEPRQPGKALRFEAQYQAERLEAGTIDELGDIHHDGVQIVISEALTEKISVYPTKGLNILPALIIDNRKSCHEAYNYLHFYKNVDCLNLNTAEFEEKRWGEASHKFDRYVHKFCLDPDVLATIPEKERMLFAIGSKSTMREVFFHRKLVDIVVSSGLKGFRFFAVPDYENGMEFMSDRMLKMKGVSYLGA